ncbi:MAG: DUF3883 domain-containing protein, partial [Meiothermus sp.]|nr:DUF3883 domain-containing protein [Meiothermus sp.]
AMGGERVYDVVGELLSEVNLEELMRQNLADRVSLEDIKARLEARLDEQVIRGLMENTQVALARQFVNLATLSRDVEISRLQRLHPEYTERFFRLAFAALGGQIESRTTPGLFAIPSVPYALREKNHPAARRFGGIPREYRRIAFEKTRARALDAELIAPGHPLFEVVLEETLTRTQEALQVGTTLYLPELQEDALLGFFTLAVQDATGAKVGERLAALKQTAQGFEIAPNHQLLDAVEAPHNTPFALPTSADPLVEYASNHLLEPYLAEVGEARGQNLAIREKYATQSFNHLKRDAQKKLAKYYQEQHRGKDMAAAIRQEERRFEQLNQRFERLTQQLAQERSLSPLPPRLVCLVRALPAPLSENVDGEPSSDPQIEAIAMQVAMDYERSQGRVPVDVSRDGVGYDLHSQTPDGKERRAIEVKGRAGLGGVKLYVSEVVTAGRLGPEYYLYIVTNCATQPVLQIIRDPAGALGAEVKAVQFEVSLAAWQAVAQAV